MVNPTTRDDVLDAASSYFFSQLKSIEDFDGFSRLVDDDMDRMKREVIGRCIERFDSEIRQSVPSSWTIVKREKRTVITLFGPVAFSRTLFKDEYGRRRYLADELLGIRKRSRFSADAVVWILKRVAVVSYGQAAGDFLDRSGASVSKMTVWNMVQREAERIERSGFDKCGNGLSQTDIFVEADGIFVALQSPERRKERIDSYLCRQQHRRRSIEIKVGCVYAGKAFMEGRMRRGNVSLIASIGSKDAFWNQMEKTIERDYASEDIENIWSASDGGSWCRDNPLGTIYPHAQLHRAYDMFHVIKKIWESFPEGESRDWLVGLAIRRKPEAIVDALRKMIPKIKNKTRRSKARDLLRYVQNGREFLRERFNLGTMEATNAYVWAKRMKRFGCAWSARGAYAMALLLARIHSGLEPIAPAADAFYTEKEEEKRIGFLSDAGGIAARQISVGSGYEPRIGHICLEKAPGAFLPDAFLHQYVR